MSDLIETMNVYVDTIDSKIDTILELYSNNFTNLGPDAIKNIKYLICEYITGIGNIIFSVRPGECASKLERLSNEANKLNSILMKYDSIGLVEMSDDCESIEISNKFHELEKEKNIEDCGSVDKKESINNSGNPDSNVSDGNSKPSIQSDGMKHKDDVDNLLSIANRHLLVNRKANADDLSFGMIVEAAYDAEIGDIFGYPLIFNLRQSLAAIRSIVEIQISLIKKAQNNNEIYGAPSEHYTSEFLANLHDLYCRESGSLEIDKNFYELIGMLAGYIDTEIKRIYGKDRRPRIKGMTQDSIRMAISRVREAKG